MTIQQKVEDAIKSGKTVLFTTYLRQIKVTPKAFSNWADHGGLFSTDDKGALFMRSGKGWVCLSGTKITVA